MLASGVSGLLCEESPGLLHVSWFWTQPQRRQNNREGRSEADLGKKGGSVLFSLGFISHYPTLLLIGNKLN